MKNMRKTVLCVLVLLAVCTLAAARQVTLRNLKLYDKKNRQVTLHGTNIVVKVPPYIPSTGAYDPVRSFGPEDIKILKDNGFNSIRLGLMWAGVEPKKDWYNQTYLDEMVKIVNAAGQAGIYTIIDFHQDLLSEKFCGDGAPIWLMDQIEGYKTFPFPLGKKIHLNKTGLPDWNDCDKDNWGTYYFTYDVGQAFNNLYSPTHRLNHKFNAYWDIVARTFKGNPYVVAYELINEPFIGNFWRNPAMVIPSMAERFKLQSFYDRLSETIRKVDSQTPICFQPVTFDNFVPTGFSHPPGGDRFKNQSIFCYHHYQPPALNLKSLDTYVQGGRKLGVASILTETHGYSQILDRAEHWKQSWFYWQYKDFGKNWGGALDKNANKPNKSKLHLANILLQTQSDENDHLIRTYLPKVAGQLQSSKFNSTTGHFTATYHAIPGGQTIMFIQKQRIYNNNHSIDVYPESQVQITQTLDNNYISIKYNGKQPNKKIMITVARI